MTIRRMRDEDGIEWQVYEVVLPEELLNAKAPRPPLNLPSAWLCFESETQRRRLTPIPEGWERVSLEELRRLLNVARKPGDPPREPPRASQR